MTRYEVELTDEQARAVTSLWQPGISGTIWGAIGNRLADAVNANPPKPPRMAEPGWGEKVKASTKIPGSFRDHRPFVRYADLTRERWSDGRMTFCWDDLIDPEPLS